MHLRSPSYTALLALLALLGGCGRDAPTTRTEAVIDGSGGMVSVDRGSATGARLEIPAGAVDAPTRFTIEAGSPDHLAPGVRAIGPMITLGPEGSRFAVPVRIVLPSSREPMVLLTRPHGGTTWTRVDGAVWSAETGVVSADVMHFSDFLPVEAEPTALDGGVADASDFCTVNPREPSCVTTDPPLPGCDALAQDCAPGQMCIATDQESGYDWGMGRPAYCVAAGTSAAGSACTAATDCGVGTQCVFQTMYDSGEGTIWYSQEQPYLPMYDSRCMTLCSGPASASGGTGCPSGEICHPVQLWGFSGRHVNEVYGVCAPPPPGSPPRG